MLASAFAGSPYSRNSSERLKSLCLTRSATVSRRTTHSLPIFRTPRTQVVHTSSALEIGSHWKPRGLKLGFAMSLAADDDRDGKFRASCLRPQTTEIGREAAGASRCERRRSDLENPTYPIFMLDERLVFRPMIPQTIHLMIHREKFGRKSPNGHLVGD